MTIVKEMAIKHKQITKCLIESSLNRYSLKWADDSYLKTRDNIRDYVIDINNDISTGLNITSTEFTGGLILFTSEGIPLNNV